VTYQEYICPGADPLEVDVLCKEIEEEGPEGFGIFKSLVDSVPIPV